MDKKWQSAMKTAAVVFLFSVAWLYLRRWGAPFGGVYIKLSFAGIAVAGTSLMAMSYLFGSLAHFWPNKWEVKKHLRKHYGLFGFYLIIVHSAWGVLLKLYPNYYARHFDKVDPTKVQLVDLPFIFGALGLLFFLAVAFASLKAVAEKMTSSVWLSVQRLGYLALLLGTAHFAFIKWKGWLNIDGWPYFLPPLSLLLFLFIVFVFIMRLLTLCLNKKS